MSEIRRKWEKAKSKMQKAGLDVKLSFKKSLGPALDAYDTAKKKLGNAPGTNPPKVDQARSDVKKAAKKALGIVGGYQKTTGFWMKNAGNANLKNAAKEADNLLIDINLRLQRDAASPTA